MFKLIKGLRLRSLLPKDYILDLLLTFFQSDLQAYLCSLEQSIDREVEEDIVSLDEKNSIPKDESNIENVIHEINKIVK